MRRPASRPYALAVFALLGLSACASAPDEGCQSPADCSGGQVCIDGACQVQSCSDAGPACLAGYTCQEGVCDRVSAAQCNADTPCPGGQRCVDGECLAAACQEGQIRDCETQCSQGQQRCVAGVWQPCSAPPAAGNDICGDQQDNDCDGTVDEGCSGCQAGGERPCETQCGTGTEYCGANGEWGGCDAERPTPEICGNNADDDCDGVTDNGCDCPGEDGAQRACATACGEGTETCMAGSWVGCTAPEPVDEICDGQDNDCDMQIDEEATRSCANACGEGVETCENGQWTGCTAPDQCGCGDGQVDEQVCGTCGVRNRECNDGTWTAWQVCADPRPGVQCSPGQAEEQPCGVCGRQRRICTADCTWGDYQECQDDGVCQPGDVETEDCGVGCGQRTRTCSDGCQWSEWSDCVAPEGQPQPECNPGDEQMEACGNCGNRARSCGATCTWGQWGLCDAPADACEPGEEVAEVCPGEGACSVRIAVCGQDCRLGEFGACSAGGQCEPGREEERACGRCGTQSRRCSQDCVYGEWSNCFGEGLCEPNETESRQCGTSDIGECSLGLETRTCGADCSWGAFAGCQGAVEPRQEVCGDGLDQDCNGSDLRRQDQYEPNNECNSCTLLNNPGEDDVERTLRATIDSAADTWDYYCFDAHDGFSVPGFSESIEATLSDIPNGADYDLFLYKTVQDCRDGNSLEFSIEGGNSVDSLQWSEPVGSDDSGRYVIGVRRVVGQSCDLNYTLEVRGLN
jgi:hypothetical protein